MQRLMPYLVPLVAMSLLAGVAFAPPPWSYLGLLLLLSALVVFVIRMEAKTGQRAPHVKIPAAAFALWNLWRLIDFFR